MAKKRRNFAPELKAKIALEALREEATISELAARYDVHPNLITNWKRQAREGMVGVFSVKATRRETAHEAKIQQL